MMEKTEYATDLIAHLDSIVTEFMNQQVGEHSYSNVMFGGTQIVIGVRESKGEKKPDADKYDNLMRQEWRDTAASLIDILQEKVDQQWELCSSSPYSATIQTVNYTPTNTL